MVGTCILALKNHLKYQDLPTEQILMGIYKVLCDLLQDDNDLHRLEKLSILHTDVLQDQKVEMLKAEELISILDFIDKGIMPYINENTAKGQDLLNLFFTTFNKYVGKADKNQAFTPDHIVSFMCDVIGINHNSRVLDPCCGSGAFLVRAMVDALNDCVTEDERKIVKKEHIYGIEAEKKAFGLSTTNMLIHGDGNSNVRMKSCFDLEDWIKKAHIDRVLMNPPYNAQRPYCQPSYVATWKKDCKEDPSKGLHYLYYIAEAVGTVIWELGIRHETANQPTFFGYFKEDGFTKRKNLGRVERIDPKTGEGAWQAIHDKWLHLYKTRSAEVGLSAVQKVSYEDEWCAEAYMETDYSTLSEKDFIQKLVDYSAFLVQNEEV